MNSAPSRKFAPERDAIINDEVKILLGAEFICEVQYPKWLANVVVVKKKNGKWRVRIDFTDAFSGNNQRTPSLYLILTR